MAKSKLSPKREAEISHRISALCISLSEGLDEMQAETTFGLEMKAECDSLIKKCEKILSDSFTVKSLNHRTYLHDLSKKLDTVIRKNFETITE